MGLILLGAAIVFAASVAAFRRDDPPLAWPTECHVVTSGYGPRVAPVPGASTVHNGIDIGCPRGSIIRAPADGTVVKVWFDAEFAGGNSLRIDHGDLMTGYAHLLSASVDEGDHVQAGQIIAHSGGDPRDPESGLSSGPHLHFTVRLDGTAVDPIPYLPSA